MVMKQINIKDIVVKMRNDELEIVEDMLKQHEIDIYEYRERTKSIKESFNPKTIYTIDDLVDVLGDFGWDWSDAMNYILSVVVKERKQK
jgi:hypothetical protein